MTREFLIATFFSLGLHLALLFSGWNSVRTGPLNDSVAADFICMTVPLVPPDEPEPIEEPEAELRPLDIAPPMQNDRIDPVRPDIFVQKLQPPRPEGIVISSEMNIVPAERNPGVIARGGPVFDVTMLDQRPVPKFQARPQYPFEMRRTGTTGEVVVEFIVDVHGQVQNAYALRSSRTEFESAAVQAVSKWSFRPGRKDARAVPTRMQVPILFTLNER